MAGFLDWGRTAGAALAGPGPVAAVVVQRVAVEAVGVVAASARALVVRRDAGLVGPEAAGRALSALAASRASWLGLVGRVGPSPGGGAAGFLPGSGDLSGVLAAQPVGLAVVARVAVTVFSAIDRESRRAGVLAGGLVAARRVVGTSAAAWGAVRDALAPVVPGGASEGGAGPARSTVRVVRR